MCFEQEQLWGPALMSGYYLRLGHFGYLGEICLLFYSSETTLKKATMQSKMYSSAWDLMLSPNTEVILFNQ